MVYGHFTGHCTGLDSPRAPADAGGGPSSSLPDGESWRTMEFFFSPGRKEKTQEKRKNDESGPAGARVMA